MIAIVGGGIVGLATAYALRDLGPVVFEMGFAGGLRLLTVTASGIGRASAEGAAGIKKCAPMA